MKAKAPRPGRAREARRMRHAIDLAISQLGIQEKTGRNDGVPAERYMRGDELAWCAGFVLWCFDQSDDEPIWNDFDEATTNDARRYWGLRAVRTMISWAKEREVWIGRNVLPNRNDVVFYGTRFGSDLSPNGQHCGIVERASPNSIATVEGNLGNQVARRVVHPGDRSILGFARFGVPRPRYAPRIA